MSYNSKELKVKYEGDGKLPKKKRKNPNVAAVSRMGYRDDSPYRSLPYIDIHTPNGTIDMSATGIPLLANGRVLPPYSGTHQFDTDTVREIPLAQKGREMKQMLDKISPKKKLPKVPKSELILKDDLLFPTDEADVPIPYEYPMDADIYFKNLQPAQWFIDRENWRKENPQPQFPMEVKKGGWLKDYEKGSRIKRQEGGDMPFGMPLKEVNPFTVAEYRQPMMGNFILPDPNRPELMNTRATEYKIGIDTDEGELQIPTVVSGQYIGPDNAVERAFRAREAFLPMADPSSYSKFYQMINRLGIMKQKKGGSWFDKYQDGGLKKPTIYRGGDQDWYDPVADIIYLSAARGDESEDHELYHKQQRDAGRLRIAEEDPYGEARRKPNMMEDQAFVDYPYYNRRAVDEDILTNDFLYNNPSFNFVSPDAVYNLGVNRQMYYTPWTAEGEARATESPEGRAWLESEGIGPKEFKKKGGWLDKYQTPLGETGLPGKFKKKMQDPTYGYGLQWFADWYSHPETQKRLEQSGLNKYDIESSFYNIEDTQFAQSYPEVMSIMRKDLANMYGNNTKKINKALEPISEFVLDNMFSKGFSLTGEGVYPDLIYTTPQLLRNKDNVFPHELIHASMLDRAIANQMGAINTYINPKLKEFYPDLYKEAKKTGNKELINEMFENVRADDEYGMLKEIYPYIQSLRYDLGVKPGEIITDEILNKYKTNYEENAKRLPNKYKSEDSDLDRLLKMYSKPKLIQFMNTVAENKQPGMEMPMAKRGGLPKHQRPPGQINYNIPVSQQDSVRNMAYKTMLYEQERGSGLGTGLSNFGNPNLPSGANIDDAVNWYMKNTMSKLEPGAFKTAMEQAEAGDFIYNAGRDPRIYMLDQYLKSIGQPGLPNRSTFNIDMNKNPQDWANKKPELDALWKQHYPAISKLSTNSRRILLNKGRDSYYQSINNPAPGVPSDAYGNTWYGRIWNTNDYEPYKEKNPKFTPKSKKIGGTSNWLDQYQVPPGQVSGAPGIRNQGQLFMATNQNPVNKNNPVNTGAVSDTTRTTIGNIKGHAPKEASLSVRKDIVDPALSALSYAKYVPIPGAAAVGAAADVASLGLAAYDIYSDVSSGNTGYGTVANASKIAGKLLKGSSNPVASGVGTALSYLNKGNAAVKAGKQFSEGDYVGAALSAGKVAKRTGGPHELPAHLPEAYNTGGTMNKWLSKYQGDTDKSQTDPYQYQVRTGRDGKLFVVVKDTRPGGKQTITMDPSFRIPGQNTTLGDLQARQRFNSLMQGEMNKANAQSFGSDQAARTAAASMPQGTPRQQVKRKEEVKKNTEERRKTTPAYVPGPYGTIQPNPAHPDYENIPEKSYLFPSDHPYVRQPNPNLFWITGGTGAGTNPLMTNAMEDVYSSTTGLGATAAMGLNAVPSLLTALSLPATVGGTTYTGATIGNAIGSYFMGKSIMNAPSTIDVVTDPSVSTLDKADAVAGAVIPFIGMGLFSGNRYLDPLWKIKAESDAFPLLNQSLLTPSSLFSKTNPNLTADAVWEGGLRFRLPHQTESVLNWRKDPFSRNVAKTTINLDDQGRTILEGRTVTPSNPNPNNYRVITDEKEALDWFKKSNEFNKFKFDWLEGQGLGPLDGFADPGAGGAADDMLKEFKLLYGHLDPGDAYIPTGTVSTSKFNSLFPHLKLKEGNQYFKPEDFMNYRGVGAADKGIKLGEFMRNIKNEFDRVPSVVEQYNEFKNLKFKTSLNDPRNLWDPRMYVMEFRGSNYASDQVKKMSMDELKNMNFDDALAEALKMKEKQTNAFYEMMKKDNKPFDKGFFDINPNKKGGVINSKKWANKYK